MNTMSEFRKREAAVFSQIPGMRELSTGSFDEQDELREKYPDAAFVTMLADDLVTGNRELTEINMKAYLAILNGESITNVRYRHEKETDVYWSRHMWDD